jgi:tRNA threonylcarbamoyladenosine modification (KEOPS) complex Cgi121 subunit
MKHYNYNELTENAKENAIKEYIKNSFEVVNWEWGENDIHFLTETQKRIYLENETFESMYKEYAEKGRKEIEEVLEKCGHFSKGGAILEIV